jgi:DNA/RNA endonuclease YhcR with UshA esterase domain
VAPSTHGGHYRICERPLLGKTKKITQRGIEEVSNEMGAFTVVRAESNEAAAKLFENHPHFTIFPGESVEVMSVLPIPGV